MLVRSELNLLTKKKIAIMSIPFESTRHDLGDGDGLIYDREDSSNGRDWFGMGKSRDDYS